LTEQDRIRSDPPHSRISIPISHFPFPIPEPPIPAPSQQVQGPTPKIADPRSAARPLHASAMCLPIRVVVMRKQRAKTYSSDVLRTPPEKQRGIVSWGRSPIDHRFRANGLKRLRRGVKVLGSPRRGVPRSWESGISSLVPVPISTKILWVRPKLFSFHSQMRNVSSTEFQAKVGVEIEIPSILRAALPISYMGGRSRVKCRGED
jgi:hypothetical protein